MHTLLEFFKNALDVFNIGVFFDQVDLVLMHETIYVGTLFNESCAKELSLTGLQAHKKIKDNNDEIIGFMWPLHHWIIEGSHDIIHLSMNSYEFENGTWHISYILKLPQHLSEKWLGSLVITRVFLFLIIICFESHIHLARPLLYGS